MRIEPRHRHGRGIGLAPLVDVVFLLLLFFLLAARLDPLQQLPIETRDGGGADTVTTILRLDVAADGELRLDGTPCPSDALVKRLRTRLAKDPTHPLAITPAPETPLQTLVQVIDQARLAGVRSLTLVEH
ncbi:ExbD/TolR family protein [Marichromatium bheemlicum]|uniref:Biopolymer transporter ExbD n=1 Tax=Marichromatium bheemlicum TaxID=365339 RepID=A0ABX1I4U7_9GAMM|nr:biopolymer transporter ExbD [Marichromatium bheemlicum]NKN31661.1 biopolymer transporter ExbD [Marichromatium bheemlicum]